MPKIFCQFLLSVLNTTTKQDIELPGFLPQHSHREIMKKNRNSEELFFPLLKHVLFYLSQYFSSALQNFVRHDSIFVRELPANCNYYSIHGQISSLSAPQPSGGLATYFSLFLCLEKRHRHLLTYHMYATNVKVLL